MPDKDFAELVADKLDRSLPVMGDALADRMGPPADSVKATNHDEDRAWQYAKQIDYDARAAALLEKLVADPAFAALPDEMKVAEISVRLTDENYPYRRDVYAIGSVSPVEMADKAERVKARVEKKQPAPDGPPAPEQEAY